MHDHPTDPFAELLEVTTPPLTDWDSITVTRLGRRRWRAQFMSERTLGMQGETLVVARSVGCVYARTRRRAIRIASRQLDPPQEDV